MLCILLFLQIYGNDNTQCPDKSGGRNVSRLYIDSSEPSDGGTGIWTQDETLSFECYDNGYKTVKCKCKSYKVFNLVNGNRYAASFLTIRAQSFTSLKADLCQDINRGFAFSRCLNGTFS